MRLKKLYIKGVGLVELLVCMMLICLIVIAVLPGLTYGLMELHESGSKTEAIYSVQQDVENQLAAISSSGSDTITVTFGSTNLSVKGKLIEEENTYGTKGQTEKIKVFIPDK